MRKFVKYKLLSNSFLIISLFFIIASFIFKDWSVYQYVIIFLAIAIYLASSVIYHHYDKSLTFEVGFEYILIGILAFLIVFGVAI